MQENLKLIMDDFMEFSGIKFHYHIASNGKYGTYCMDHYWECPIIWRSELRLSGVERLFKYHEHSPIIIISNKIYRNARELLLTRRNVNFIEVGGYCYFKSKEHFFERKVENNYNKLQTLAKDDDYYMRKIMTAFRVNPGLPEQSISDIAQRIRINEGKLTFYLIQMAIDNFYKKLYGGVFPHLNINK